MIRVPRADVNPPADLVGDDSPGARERRKAEELYQRLVRDPAKDPSRDFKFEFRAYKRDAVKAALQKLFHGKCAYCETRYASTQPMDVEHWRPKGLAKRDDGLADMKPGYYWLAADWENLLPSCIDCNRSRTQVVPPGHEEVNLGKANQFPVADENRRVVKHEDAAGMDNEEPLILHPCDDDPGEHLEFTPEAVVRPRLDAGGAASVRGEHSIDVYALNRTGLVLSRRELLDLIVQRKFAIEHLIDIHAEVQELAAGTAAAVAKKERLELLVEELLLHELKALRALTQPDRPYSLLARQFVHEFLDDIRQDLPVAI